MASLRDNVPQVVILAGGDGTRLARQVPNTAKWLAPVHGRPFASYVLPMLAAQGVRRLHMCLGKYAADVQAFLDTCVPAGITVTSTVEPEPLGTAGALRAAASALDDEFVLLLGDTYTPIDFADLTARYRKSGKEAGMAVLENNDWLVPSNVRIEDGLVIEYDKQAQPGQLRHVDYGIAVLRPACLARIPAGRADLAVLFDSLIAECQLAALEVGHRFYEIGSPRGYAEFIELWKRGDIPARAVALNDTAPKQAVASRQLYSSRWMRVREDTVRQRDGSLAPFAVVSRSDSVLVICELPDGRLLMTEQYRYAVGRWSLEFPQGGREPGESVAEAALRELREETGWEAEDVRMVADRLYEAGDWATQSFAVVTARLIRADRPTPETGEHGLRLRYVAPDKIVELVHNDLLYDAATLAAWGLYRAGMNGTDEQRSRA